MCLGNISRDFSAYNMKKNKPPTLKKATTTTTTTTTTKKQQKKRHRTEWMGVPFFYWL